MPAVHLQRAGNHWICVEDDWDVLETLRKRHPEIPEACFTAAKLVLSNYIPATLQIERGYNLTIILIWTDISVEVSEVDYEYYDVGRRQNDIRQYPHLGGTNIAAELVNLLCENCVA